MRLSRTVEYAVQATLQLAQSTTGAPVPCSQLAANGHMPERFLLQILRNLVTHGILQSTRGVVGGYSLAKPPGEISLLEIIEAVEGPIESTAPATTPLDSKAEAKLRQALDQVNETVRRGLSAILLEHLVKPSTVPPSHFGGALADRTAQQ